MKIYTFWNSTSSATDDQAQMLRLWERSWSAHGWEPRLLTIFNSKQSRHYKPSGSLFDQMFFALHAVGGGWLALPSVINAGLKPYRPKHPVVIDPWVMVYMNKRKAGGLSSSTVNCRRFPLYVLNQRRVFDTVAAALESGLCH